MKFNLIWIFCTFSACFPSLTILLLLLVTAKRKGERKICRFYLGAKEGEREREAAAEKKSAVSCDRGASV